MPKPPSIYAIDFGTSNSLVAAANDEQVFEPIPLEPDASDPTILRTVLFFPSAKRCFYGAEALRQYVEHGMDGRLIRSIKKHLPSRSFLGTHVFDRPMRLEDLVGAFLGELRRRANRHFGVDIRRVLLGRPARFSLDDIDDAFGERRLRDAAILGGFDEVFFCPEPVAAARDFKTVLDVPQRVLVADFGGGTSDYTVVRMRSDGYDPSDVLALGGVSLAGDALDGSIMRGRIAKHFGADVTYAVPMGRNELRMPKPIVEKLCSPADLSILARHDMREFLKDVRRWALGEDDRRRIDQLFTLVEDALGFDLFEAIERSKRALSDTDQTTFTYRYPSIAIDEELRRDDFEREATPTTERILGALDDTLNAAEITPEQIDLVCTTGGTAEVPCIRRELWRRFGRDKVAALQTYHSVILGLAERARAVAAGQHTVNNATADRLHTGP